MNILSEGQRAHIVQLLCEGNGIRGIHRLTGTARPTIQTIILELGKACEVYMKWKHQNLPCQKVEADEVWSFVQKKEQRVPPHLKGYEGEGDCWTFSAFCPHTKLVISWVSGRRTIQTATRFIEDLSYRIPGRFTLVTDQFSAYEEVVRTVFRGREVDYAQVLKQYSRKSPKSATYVSGVIPRAVVGVPDLEKAKTTAIERVYLTLRTGSRRFARKTNGHSKTAEHHKAMLALFICYYNYCRPHRSLEGKTPAQAMELSPRRWSMGDLASLMEARRLAKSPEFAAFEDSVDPNLATIIDAALLERWSKG